MLLVHLGFHELVFLFVWVEALRPSQQFFSHNFFIDFSNSSYLQEMKTFINSRTSSIWVEWEDSFWSDTPLGVCNFPHILIIGIFL